MSQEGQDDPLHIDTPPPNSRQDTDSPETVSVEKETEETRIQDDAAENRDAAGETEILSHGARPDEEGNKDTLINGAEEEERRKEQEQVKDDAGKNEKTEHSNGGIVECEGCDDRLPHLEDSAEPQRTVRLVIQLCIDL